MSASSKDNFVGIYTLQLHLVAGASVPNHMAYDMDKGASGEGNGVRESFFRGMTLCLVTICDSQFVRSEFFYRTLKVP